MEIKKYNPPILDEEEEDIALAINKSTESLHEEVTEKKVLIENDIKTFAIIEEQNKLILEKLELLTNLDSNEMSNKLEEIQSNQLQLIQKLDKDINTISNQLQDNIDFSSTSKIEVFETLNKNSSELLKFITDMEASNKKLIKKILFKILDIEISSHSDKIITHFLKSIYDTIKDSKFIKIKLSDSDYLLLNKQIENLFDNELLSIESDSSVKKGGVVIFSDNINYDNNLQDKLDLIIDSIF